MAKTSQNVVSSNILLGIIIFLLMIIFFLSYKLYNLTLMDAGILNKAQENSIIAATIPLSNNKFTNTPQGLLFTHPQLGYKIIIPKEWTGREYRSLAGAAVQPYRDIVFLSPDYTETPTNNTEAIIEEGSSIFIRGTDTPYKTIEERFANNVVAKKVATNVVRRTINGIPVIQYEYELTGENVTNVTMIKDGIWYLIKFQYADSKAKVQYQEVFESVISSFKTK